jgi:F-type H+-transporting ATPase subunit epsilon
MGTNALAMHCHQYPETPMNDFQLQIYSREKKAFDGQVVSIIVPALGGKLGVQAHHAPLVALLGVGELWIRKADGGEQTFRLSGGFLEVARNVATLLVDELHETPGD